MAPRRRSARAIVKSPALFYRLFLPTLALLAGLWARPASAAGDAGEAVAGKWDRRATAAGVEKPMAAAVGFPDAKAEAAGFTSAQPVPAGVYELTFDAIASHVGDGIAWYGGLSLREPAALNEAVYPARLMGRPGKPATLTALVVQPKSGPFRAVFSAVTDKLAMGPAFAKRISDRAVAKRGAPRGGGVPSANSLDAGDAGDGGLDLVELSPATHFYFLVDNVRLKRVSDLGYPASLNINKIRYAPGEELRGSVTLASLDAAAPAELSLFLENGLRERRLAKKIPVPAFAGNKPIDFAFPVPKEELGYTLVASLARADGSQAAERSTCFTVADNFYRVAIHYTGVVGRNRLKIDPDELKAQSDRIRENYANCYEIFAWAQEDMVGMSPEQDVWFSGQTCYQISKPYMQAMIRASHEAGIAAVSYGKFIMSGYLGWKTAWDRPLDHRRQFEFPVGMWDGTNERDLQWFRYGEFIPENRPDTGGMLAWLGRPGFIPVNPDPTPAMVRVAAEHIVQSIKMFGWDGVRWDGHPRGDDLFAGQLGGPGRLDPWQARKTQALVKYCKDLVALEEPRTRWGYNYLFTQNNPTHDWGTGDFELDELCADGGLVMNESIRKSQGMPFEHIAQNLQVQGDLARERGGYLLFISCDEVSERDSFIEGILYYAGGCRPYGAAGGFRELNRYATRYGCYTLDERLRRLARPQEVLAPAGATPLWWTPFVYETPRGADGKSQLVVNLLNLPYKDPVLMGHDKNASLALNQSTDPVSFALKLPAGYSASRASLIDPFTLAVTPLTLSDGKFTAPPVPIWSVVVIDLASDAQSPSLGERLGPPATFQKKKEGIADVPRIVLDPKASTDALWKQMCEATQNKGWTGGLLLETAEAAAMPAGERDAALLKKRDDPWLQPEKVLASEYSSHTLKPDWALKDQPPGDNVEPLRNGVVDVFLGCGVLADRLRLPEALASMPRFSLSTGDLWGGRGRTGMGGLSPESLARLDLVVFHDMPAMAIGARNTYMMRRWLRGGGGALFTGGPNSFGKGAYLHTLLDRELLPVQVCAPLDIRYIKPGAAIEPGPDLAALGLDESFKADLLKTRPMLWAFNEVALRPGADVKVFLKAGNRPILVGWQVGEGRVACLLAATMGTSGNGATAFAQWDRWPQLLSATLRWLTPHAGEVKKQETKTPMTKDAATQLLEDNKMDRAIDVGGPDGKAPAPRKGVEKTGEAIRTLLTLGAGDPAAAAVLADQLGAEGALSAALAEEVVRFLAQNPPPADRLAEAGRRCAGSTDPSTQGLGMQAYAMAGAGEFRKAIQQLPDPVASGATPQARWGTMLGIALYRGDDLAALGKARVKAWDATQQQRMTLYTGGKAYSPGFPPVAHLDSDALLERAAWLGQLYSLAPAEYARPLMREWLWLGRYAEFCDQTADVLAERAGKGPPQQAGPLRARVSMVQELKRYYLQLAAIQAPLVRDAFAKFPPQAADALADTFSRSEVNRAMNLLGNAAPADTRPILEKLIATHHPHLEPIAARRLTP